MATARAGPNQSQVLKVPLESSMCVAEAKAFRPSSAGFSGTLARSLIRSGEARTQSSAHMECWHHGDGLTHCCDPTTPALAT